MKLFVITGTCGAGKSTMKDYLSKRLTNELYVPVDVDEVGLTGGIMPELKMNQNIMKIP